MESNLALKKSDLDSYVGDYAGYGVGSVFGGASWNSRHVERIRRSVSSGLRSVYQTQEVRYPSGELMIPGSYDWSWLKPTQTIDLPSGSNAIDMADDFGGIIGRVIPANPNGNGAIFPIPVVGQGDIEAAEAMNPGAAGRPLMVCQMATKKTSKERSNQNFLKFFPSADQSYSLKLWYFILPEMISDDLPYPYGGAAHAELFKVACTAAYSAMYDDPGTAQAEHAKFLQRLKASIEADRKMKPSEIGRNRDSSDDAWWSGTQHYGTFGFTVNGIAPQLWNA